VQLETEWNNSGSMRVKASLGRSQDDLSRGGHSPSHHFPQVLFALPKHHVICCLKSQIFSMLKEVCSFMVNSASQLPKIYQIVHQI
jgi:hypothetical protein